MMTSNDIVDGVVAWAREVVPELVAGYNYEPLEKGELPDVVVVLNLQTATLGSTDFPLYQFQQAWILRHDLSISFMQDNSDPQTATTNARTWADDLRSSCLADGTLGDRVPFASPYMSFDYTPPFVEYPDGTRGREMTMTISIADLLEVQ